MDLFARICFGDISLRRGECKVDMRNGSYLWSLPSVVGYNSGRSGSLHRPSRVSIGSSGSASAGAIASRGRRAC